MPLNEGSLGHMVEHERETNTHPLDLTLTNMLKTFLTTGRGWILRKAVDGITNAATALGAYEAAHGIPGSVIGPETAFIVAAGSWLAGLGLSRLADTANKEMPPPAPVLEVRKATLAE